MFFESTDDVRWLYFELTLSGLLADSEIESELRALVHDPIFEALYEGKKRYAASTASLEQAARYVDRRIFHCTALRDFFVVRLTESLVRHVSDPIKDRLVFVARAVMAAFVSMAALALYAFGYRWTMAAIVSFLLFKVAKWTREIDLMRACKERNRFTRAKIEEIVATVARGGYDEPTIIRELENFDVRIPPVPKLVTIYGCPYFLGSHPNGIQEHTIPIPDVLYALLRLPRRNVESELAKTFYTLNDETRYKLKHGWRKLVDPLLVYQETNLI